MRNKCWLVGVGGKAVMNGGHYARLGRSPSIYITAALARPPPPAPNLIDKT